VRVAVVQPAAGSRDLAAETIGVALRDAGMEVVYAGRGKTAAETVQIAIQEDVDAVGLTVPPSESTEAVFSVLEGLRRQDAADILVVVRADLSPEESARLERAGVGAVFSPDASAEAVVAWIEESCRDHRRGASKQEAL
jgi:methylmalonyl-CoA mutase cobalamin-binding domain/chain